MIQFTLEISWRVLSEFAYQKSGLINHHVVFFRINPEIQIKPDDIRVTVTRHSTDWQQLTRSFSVVRITSKIFLPRAVSWIICFKKQSFINIINLFLSWPPVQKSQLMLRLLKSLTITAFLLFTRHFISPCKVIYLFFVFFRDSFYMKF